MSISRCRGEVHPCLSCEEINLTMKERLERTRPAFPAFPAPVRCRRRLCGRCCLLPPRFAHRASLLREHAAPPWTDTKCTVCHLLTVIPLSPSPAVSSAAFPAALPQPYLRSGGWGRAGLRAIAPEPRPAHPSSRRSLCCHCCRCRPHPCFLQWADLLNLRDSPFLSLFPSE